MSDPMSERNTGRHALPHHLDQRPLRSDRSEPLYPDVTVRLTGTDGSIGSVMARVRDALTQAGVENAGQVMSALWAEVMSADNYQLALQAVMRVVHVE